MLASFCGRGNQRTSNGVNSDDGSTSPLNNGIMCDMVLVTTYPTPDLSPPRYSARRYASYDGAPDQSSPSRRSGDGPLLGIAPMLRPGAGPASRHGTSASDRPGPGPRSVVVFVFGGLKRSERLGVSGGLVTGDLDLRGLSCRSCLLKELGSPETFVFQPLDDDDDDDDTCGVVSAVEVERFRRLQHAPRC
ncbi:hypothetical protein CKAH01_07355 [Colletotrichum kahawae]|uniref:Uncharacterized protein n=1 Tax=Colletotrichum kahawae TaxID=34407 RepID=A0AAD9Y5N7_COLKA|nr:hypothetical protein CKAH01_07355 [Colletotrichum kahawae]